MSNKAIIYGDIINHKERQKIEDSYPNHSGILSWKNEPTLFESGNDSPLVFVDLDSPRFSSPDFLVSVATTGRNVKVVGKSEKPNLDETIRVSKLGVSEVLTPDQCLIKLNDFLKELEGDTVSSNEKSSKFTADALIGKSRQIVEIRKMVRLLSDVDFPSALILGETGSGKSLISKILHNTGSRSMYNIVEVNCSAIPDELFESELFGHAKGAFTDAKTEKVGLFEYAQNGTLFLDEVGNLSAAAQAKLLKILEDKKLRKVGEVNERDINVRVVTATNLNLVKAIEEGKFREDLFFRLNLLTIEIPPLKERPEDIPGIVEHYMNFYSTLYGKPGVCFHQNAIDEMQKHPWPGNVRELCNVIERAVLLIKKDVIELQDIKAVLKKSRLSVIDRQQINIDIPPQGISLQEIEHNVVRQVLNMCNWNKSEAAKFLNISRPRLRRIIESAGLEQNRRNS